jgi:hypothetical protein
LTILSAQFPTEAVEPDNAVGARCVELPRNVAEGREEWGNFHGDGDFQARFSSLT